MTEECLTFHASTPLSIHPPKYKEAQSIPFHIQIDSDWEIKSYSKQVPGHPSSEALVVAWQWCKNFLSRAVCSYATFFSLAKENGVLERR